MRIAVVIALWGAASVTCADDVTQERQKAVAANCIRIEAFLREGSPLSESAAKFLRSLEARRDGVIVDIRDVSDPDADARARKLLAEFRVEQPGLPIVHACRQLIVGYRGDETTGRQIENLLTINAYVRQGCPHCADAKQFFERMRSRYPGFQIQYHDIISDPGARDRVMELAKRYNVVANVPAFHFCGTLVVGYERDATSGRRLEELMRSACVPCRDGDEERMSNWRGRSRFPAAMAAGIPLVLHSFPVFDSEAGASDDLPPLEDLPLEELPLEEQPLEDRPVGDPPEEEVHELPPAGSGAEGDLPDNVDLPVFGNIDAAQVGLPLFTVAIGLVDGFNPCAMWVLLFLLSILVNLKDRRKILAVAGTFVVISGLAYYAFMAAWLNVFLLVGFLRPTQVVLGLLAVFIGVVHVKDFFALHKGISLSIPESAKPGIYARVRRIVTADHLAGAILGAAVLAVMVNVVELLCTAGLPALYTQILTLRELPAWQNYAYLALYNVAYMADDALMVSIVVVTLGRHKMQERHGRWLKFVSGVAVLTLGLVLLFAPEWLI